MAEHQQDQRTSAPADRCSGALVLRCSLPSLQPLIVGNWKMNKTPSEARDLARALVADLADVSTREIVVCPPFPSLPAVSEVLRGSNIRLGAQNMHFEKSGAFTGEVSGLALRELGCSHVILGHSERRQLSAETDQLVSRKLRAALDTGLSPIVCLGESRETRDGGQTLSWLETQFTESIASVARPADVVTIAYEPIWAIGTGQTATPEQAGEVHRFLRDLACRRFSAWTGSLRILYGGSVTPDNMGQLMARPEIDGVLVGGASLDSAAFARIVRF